MKAGANMLTCTEVFPNSWRMDCERPDQAEQAFEAAMELWEDGQRRQAEQALWTLLKTCPDDLDVWHQLGLMQVAQKRPQQAYLCWREAVRLGQAALPPSFSWLRSRLEWGFFENRAFLRACHALALALLEQKHGDGAMAEAMEILARLVSVCPNDNLGARYVLMGCYLETEDWQAAVELSQRYPEDCGPDMAYSKVVALLQLARDEEAEQSLLQALRYGPNVAVELLKSRHVRPKREELFAGYMQVGGADEAFDYWQRNKIH
ncbi:tetratricopeptide repeat protein [Allofranklinella schreckenbergeri]|nr:tetratricopeptide repeat protein [Allofranklinella schreckenbergeri]